MDRNFARALPLVLKHEGGWSDHPLDKGGATMKGVTLATFRRFVKPNATKEDLRKITDAQISTVYYGQYWAACNCQGLPAGVDYAVFDYAVNSGTGRAPKVLQRIVGAVVDGKVGPATIAAVEKMGAAKVINALCDERMTFLRGLPTWPTFGKGWASRVAGVRTEALRMVGRPADVVKVVETVETVPHAVDATVKAEASKGGWSLAGAGAFLAPLTGFVSGDWRTTLAIAGTLIVVGLIGLVLKGRIIAAIADIRAATEG